MVHVMSKRGWYKTFSVVIQTFSPQVCILSLQIDIMLLP
jgi:hypothetical protein